MQDFTEMNFANHVSIIYWQIQCGGSLKSTEYGIARSGLRIRAIVHTHRNLTLYISFALSANKIASFRYYRHTPVYKSWKLIKYYEYGIMSHFEEIFLFAPLSPLLPPPEISNIRSTASSYYRG